MRSVILNVLGMSLTGGVLFLAATAFVPLTRRLFSANWHRTLYCALLAFFVVPLGPLFLALPVGETSVFHEGVWGTIPAPLIGYAPAGQALPTQTAWVDLILPYLPGIWLGTALVLLFVMLVQMLRFRRVLAQSGRPCHKRVEEILQATKITMGVSANIKTVNNPCLASPMLMGVVHPTLVLPEIAWKDEELEFVLRHELTHYRHKDLWIKSAGAVIAAVHWFNPMIWLLLRHLDGWMELACDEAVADRMDAGQRQAYGAAILEVLQQGQCKQAGIFAAFGAGKHQMKERLKAIMRRKKISPKVRVGSIVFLVAFCLVGILTGMMMHEPVSAAIPNDAPPERSAADLIEEEVISPDADPAERSTATSIPVEDADPEPPRFLWPTDGGEISYAFYAYPGHTGVDIVRPAQTEIYASAAGIVTVAEHRTVGYGIYLVLDHGGGYQTLYAHCSELLVEVGDEVEAGQAIAKIGKSGNSTGTQLHFEVRKDGGVLDPQDYITQ